MFSETWLLTHTNSNEENLVFALKETLLTVTVLFIDVRFILICF